MLDLSLLTHFAALPGFDIVELIKWGGVAGVTLIVFAESGLLIGFFLPGDSLLFTAGFLIHTGLLPINLYLFIAIIFAAAVLGDSVGYTFGRRVGRKVFERPNSKLFKQEYLQQAEIFYEKHGGKTIILARFIPIIRTFAPIVAGTAKMPYHTFLTYNIVGGFIWTAGVTSLGYVLGAWFESMGIDIDHVLLPIVLVIILISVLPPIIHIFKDKKQRDNFKQLVKRQFDVLLRRKK